MDTTVRLYSTLTRRREDFHPLELGSARIYSCGPTVYRYAHVGNLRTYLFADVLCRVLEYLDHQVTQVMNITDVGHLVDDQFDRGEDKMLVSVRLENRSAEEIAAYYTGAFLDDARKAGIRPAQHYPRATDYIPRMQEIIARLIERGAQAIILGCTEIMLLISDEDSGVPLFDTTTLHAIAAVDRALTATT